jgi:hypothetical protein
MFFLSYFYCSCLEASFFPNVRLLLIECIETMHINRNSVWYIFVPASMPGWLNWGFWVSPLAYAQISIAINEFLSPRWQKVKTHFFLQINKWVWLATIEHLTSLLLVPFQETIQNITIGNEALINHGQYYSWYFYWISVGALLGCIILFNTAFGLALTYITRKFTANNTKCIYVKIELQGTLTPWLEIHCIMIMHFFWKFQFYSILPLMAKVSNINLNSNILRCIHPHT